MSASASERRHDVLIQGGGLTGLALAAALGEIGISVAVVEASPLETLVSQPYDGRVIALALGSKRLLDSIGAWSRIEPEAEPILDIEVGEPGSLGRVHYDHSEVGDEPFGWIVENRVLRTALLATIATRPSVHLHAPRRSTEIERDAHGAKLLLDDGTVLRGRLLAVCEGPPLHHT